MKKIIYLILFIALFACGSEQYGSIPPNANKIKVKDAMLNVEHLNKEVILEGKIVTQCAANGCWFFLRDDTGQILVDLKPLNLGLPQRTGKTAVVSGVLIKEPSGQIIISAKGLLIK
ncbi:MAG: DNA-binding protein [Proteobacteria bacterium]|nr:DNA-binding protein [Pseudomonadota bacterium]